jgi:hypothetical protein
MATVLYAKPGIRSEGKLAPALAGRHVAVTPA